MTAATDTIIASHDRDAQARRNARTLAAGQALGGAGSAIIISTGGLIGHMLADDKALATLPVTCFILGTAFSTLPANLVMRHIGRRLGYMLGGLIGALAALVAASGIYLNSFWIFALGLLLSGGYWAFVQSYRFAAADTASDLFKAKAISWVMIGGVVAAVLGPQTVIWTKTLFEPFLFVGTYLAAAVLCLLAMLLMLRIDIPKPKPPSADDGARPLSQIVVQPRFLVAAGCAAAAYAMMSLVMTASPLAMVACGLSTSDAALGIQWHVMAMYIPSFFTGNLIARFGKEKVVAAGMVLLAGAALSALTGLSVTHFWSALILLGVGWNFGFIGATAMLTDCHAPSERNKVQGLNDFLVFGLNAVASFSSGLMLNLIGWGAVNMVVFPTIFLGLAALVWLAGSRRKTAEA